jgi:CrcB protein
MNAFDPRILAAVAIGGAAGSVARYAAGVLVPRLLPSDLPLGTLFVNILGGFLIGLLAELLTADVSPLWRPFLITGVLGGFTTFSAFSLEAVSLGRPLGLLYVALSVLGALAACWAGQAVAR